MLSEQEIMNNAFKDLLFHEEVLTKKYGDLRKTISDPKLLQLIQGLEQSSRTRYSMLSEKMSRFGIV